MMFPFYLRAIPADYPSLISSLLSHGIIEQVGDKLVEIAPNNFNFIGVLEQGTGVFIEVDGKQVEQKTPIVDSGGVAYWHVNILTRTDLKDALRYSPFVLQDQDGYPRAPANPQVVFIQ